MPNIWKRIAGAFAAALLVSSLAVAPQGAVAGEHGLQPSESASQPTVEGPIPEDEGIRGGPYGRSLIDLPEGWVEEEFFYGGTARTSATATEGGTSYKGRILVRRPTDPGEFNGTVVIEWNNVTIPHDHDVDWPNYWQTVFNRGFVYVGVAAQNLSVNTSPAALKQWDPVRYQSLDHPGDSYSFDIYSQASEAVLDPKVLGDLRPHVERRISTGASQSAGRLSTYINQWQEHHGVFDGFQPQVSGPGSVRRDVAPIVWINSQAEVGGTGVAADDGLFRLWEITGPAHTTHYTNNYRQALLIYANSNYTLNTFDHEAEGAWGYQFPPGTCANRNLFPAYYIWGAALVTLDNWIRTGVAPEPQPRVEREGGSRLYDELGNLRGGVRSPFVDVPIAAYFGGGAPPGTEPCGAVGGRLPLTAFSRVLDPLTLAELYPTREDYLEKFEDSVEDMLAAGTLLPEMADEMLTRAQNYPWAP